MRGELRRWHGLGRGARPRLNGRARASVALLAALACSTHISLAHGQACCASGSGLTPGWLGNHDKALVGVQVRGSATWGTYPYGDGFFERAATRDARYEGGLFGALRLLPRAQVAAFAPVDVTRRFGAHGREAGGGVGDLSLMGRYDLVRTGELRIPGIALLAGALLPTGRPVDRATGLLAADATGTGTFEFDLGMSVEQTFGRALLHATALAGPRLPRDVLGQREALGTRGLFVLAGGYVFEGETSLLLSLSHASEGDASIDGARARGTGTRTTQAAVIAVVPLSDSLKLRSTVFSDLPPLGENRPTLAGSSLAILWSFR